MTWLLVIGFPDERFGKLGDTHLHSFHETEREALKYLEESDARWGREPLNEIYLVVIETDLCPHCERPIRDMYGPHFRFE